MKNKKSVKKLEILYMNMYKSPEYAEGFRVSFRDTIEYARHDAAIYGNYAFTIKFNDKTASIINLKDEKPKKKAVAKKPVAKGKLPLKKLKKINAPHFKLPEVTTKKSVQKLVKKIVKHNKMVAKTAVKKVKPKFKK